MKIAKNCTGYKKRTYKQNYFEQNVKAYFRCSNYISQIIRINSDICCRKKNVQCTFSKYILLLNISRKISLLIWGFIQEREFKK